ncbi:MAG: porin family protein [Bacteroidota bacterium]
MKRLFTLLMVLGIYTASNAQDKKLEFGFGAGINSSYLSLGSDFVDVNKPYNLGTGLIWEPNIFVSAAYNFNPKWALKAKVYYDSKGSGDGIKKASVTGGQNANGVYFPLKYITVPITAQLSWGREKNWYASGGGYVGFLLSAKENFANTDLKNEFSSTDAGISLGLGLKFPLSKSLKLFIEADRQFGLTNVWTADKDGAQTQRTAFSVGINF